MSPENNLICCSWYRGDNEVRGKLDGPLLLMLNELRKEVSLFNLVPRVRFSFGQHQEHGSWPLPIYAQSQ